MAVNDLSKHFWQIIYPEDLKQGRLRISEEFVKEYGHLLSDEVMLKVPDGKVWKIGLAKQIGCRKERIWLKAGFCRFLEYYSIDAGYLLTFEFGGSSRFQALVFDFTACEIVYPISSSPDSDSDSDSDSDFDFDEPCFRHGNRGKGVVAAAAGKNGGNASSSQKKQKQEQPRQYFPDLDIDDSDSDSSDSDPDFCSPDFRGRNRGKQVAPAKNNGGNASSSRPPNAAGASFTNAEELWSRLEKSTIIKTKGFNSRLMKLPEASQRAISRAFDISNPKNPSFLVDITTSQANSGNMNLPIRITADGYMREDLQKMTMRVFDGEEEIMVDEREVNLFERKGKQYGGKKYICGWISFCKDHRLVNGDVCLFELVKPQTNVFNVRKFHAGCG